LYNEEIIFSNSNSACTDNIQDAGTDIGERVGALWKRATYDASLAWYLKSPKFSPVVELGYRYLDSKTTGIDNYGNVYASIGIRY
jgi:hypothetical protein